MLMSQIIGHRGVAGLAPENTLAGVRAAAELGLEWVELDVTLLGDDQPVIFHDSRINRTTDRKGHIKSLGLKEARTLDAGSWHSDEFAGEAVPTLLETLELVKGMGLGLNLELKVNRCNTRRLAHVTANDLEYTNFPRDKLLVSSFNHKTLRHFRGVHSARTGCLFDYLPVNWRHRAKQVGASSVHLNGEKLTRRKAGSVKKAGYELYCYTTNEEVEAKKLIDWGVDGVFTDYPQRLAHL